MKTIKFALIKDGKITTEKEIQTKKISIGSNIDNDIFILKEALPKKHILISKLKKNYKLYLPKNSFAFIYYNNTTEKITEDTNIPVNSILRIYIDETNVILIKLIEKEFSIKEITKGISKSLLTIDPMSMLMFIVFIILYFMMINKFNTYHKKISTDFNKIPQNFEKIVLEAPKIKKEPQLRKEPKKTKSLDLSKKHISNKKKALRGRKRKSNGKKIKSNQKVRSAGLVGLIGSMKSHSKGSAVANLLSTGNLNKKLSESLKNAGRLKIATDTEEAKARVIGGSISGVDIGDLKTYTGKGAISYENIDVNAEEMFGKAEATGSDTLNTELVTKSLMQHAGGLQFCYNKELRRNPYLEGVFKIQFTIKLNGRVSLSSLKMRGSSKISSTMIKCIKRVFSRIIFPAPSGSALTIRYPINFEKTS